jgi:hypothetical protein
MVGVADIRLGVAGFTTRLSALPGDLDHLMQRRRFKPLCDKEQFCSLVKLQKDAMGMALQFYLAQTGQRLQSDPGQFTS